jgi:hypothetical protein
MPLDGATAKGTQLFPAHNKKLCPTTFLSLNLKPRQRIGCSPFPELKRNAIDLTFTICYHKLIVLT